MSLDMEPPVSSEEGSSPSPNSKISTSPHTPPLPQQNTVPSPIITKSLTPPSLHHQHSQMLQSSLAQTPHSISPPPHKPTITPASIASINPSMLSPHPSLDLSMDRNHMDRSHFNRSPLDIPERGGYEHLQDIHPMYASLSRPNSKSPPPVSLNDPIANECKIIDYRGTKIAAFVINGVTMLCLPQAFELFLKHLVGGLHTVYTKLKRLDIVPVVCNVEQVRILRGLGAIQPGVNRCKLLSCDHFDQLYKDCTTARYVSLMHSRKYIPSSS